MVTNEIICITIKTVDGDDDGFKFKQTTLVEEAKNKAMKEFSIVPPLGVKYRLAEKKNDNYRPLDDSKTIEAEDVKNKEILWLGTEQQVG